MYMYMELIILVNCSRLEIQYLHVFENKIQLKQKETICIRIL